MTHLAEKKSTAALNFTVENKKKEKGVSRR